VLAADLVAGSTALPVFSFAEEARLFIRLSPRERAGWWAAKVGARELASSLLGPLRDVGRVALDPLEKPFGNPKGLHSEVPRGAITRRELGP
jgi:hypothetical protein